MTLKQKVHALIDELPDDSAYLRDLLETLRIGKALDEAEEDIREGRVYTPEQVRAMIDERWPQEISA